MAQWHKVAKFQDLAEGAPLAVALGEHLVALFRVGERCYAVSNVCTHQFALLSDGYQEGQVIECPLHQAKFDVATGKCLGPPAEEDLRTFQVKVEDGEILLRID